MLRLDGIAKNVDAREVRFLELSVASKDGNNLLLEAMSLPEIVLRRDEFSPFQMQLPIRGTQGRIALFYQYRLAAPADQPNPTPAPEKQFTV